jgi:hypothetical protein
MAQRVTGFARKPVAAAEAIAAAGALARVREEDTPQEIPLELSTLIAPYRKHGRLSLRVERLPPRARLTRGHNNGDRSWSLMSDELDGLAYLPPGGASEGCTLGIRIVSLDGGDGATLALLDYPVMRDGAPPPIVVEKPAPQRRAPESDTAEALTLKSELAKTKAALVEREKDLAEAASQLEKAKSRIAADPVRDRTGETEALRLQGELAKTKSTLIEREKELAEAASQLDKARSRAAAETPRDRAGEAEALKLQGELAKTKVALIEREKELAEAETQLDKARSRAAAETARDKSDEAERRRLRDEVARLKKSLSALESEAKETLAQAEQGWRDAEAARFAAARSQWQDRSERALADATAQLERSQSAKTENQKLRLKEAESELERLKDGLAEANEILADRENDIAEMQSRLDETAGRDAENARLNGDIAALRAAVAERERDIDKARADLDRAQLDWRKQSEEQLAKAEAAWKKDEAARAGTAELRAQEQAQALLARAAQKHKQLAAEFEHLKAHAEALRARGDSEDIKKLRQEFGHLQAVLAERDMEIARLRLDSEHARERWTAEARMSVEKAERDWHAEADEAEEKALLVSARRRTVRDVVLVGALSVVAVMAYLRFDFSSLAGLWPSASWVQPSDTGSPPVAAAQKGAAPAKPIETAVVLRAANVRAEPSKTAEVIATLARDADVAAVEHRGNWVRVKLDGAHKEGWVYSTYLKETSAPVPQKHG